VIRLLDAVIFNALIGHHGAHAKNFSILYQTQAATLAPLYDLLCTAVYPTLTDKMAMKVGSKYRFAKVQARHWEQFAKAAGLSEAQAKKRVAGIAKQLPACARRLQTEALYSDQPLVERIVSLIEQRCAITLERLNT
jgi:serine/threonine-protein kinase HipA